MRCVNVFPFRDLLSSQGLCVRARACVFVCVKGGGGKEMRKERREK